MSDGADDTHTSTDRLAGRFAYAFQTNQTHARRGTVLAQLYSEVDAGRDRPQPADSGDEKGARDPGEYVQNDQRDDPKNPVRECPQYPLSPVRQLPGAHPGRQVGLRAGELSVRGWLLPVRR